MLPREPSYREKKINKGLVWELKLSGNQKVNSIKKKKIPEDLGRVNSDWYVNKAKAAGLLK